MPPKKKSAAGSARSTVKGQMDRSPSPMEKPDHPEDIFPLLLTSSTQELFECRADEDVTKENPFKLLKKNNIIHDIKTRAAESDFSPVKQIVLDYLEDEMLLVFDRDLTYGHSFYLVLTPEAKDRIFSPPEPEKQEVLEDKTPEPKQWMSFGSEKEIDEACVKETREKLLFKFSRLRRKFGAPVCFSDRSTADAKDSYLECSSNKDSTFSIKRMQGDCGVQAVPRLQSSSAQTQWIIQRNIFTQYKARELNKEEIESILQTESLKNFCSSVTPRMLKALQQQEVLNVFSDDWKVLTTEADAGDFSGTVSEGLTLYHAFVDLKYTKNKKVSCINWHPTIYGVIAVALTKRKLQQFEKSTLENTTGSFIVFYSFSDSSQTQLLLECPDDVVAFEFCPTDPNMIVGGCANGQVVLWDVSDNIAQLERILPGPKIVSELLDMISERDVFNTEIKTPVVHYCAVSSLESSYKEPVTDVKWLPPTFEVTRTGLPVENKNNKCAQFATCSPDSSVLFWDVRGQKLSTPSASEGKQNEAQMKPYSVPEKIKLLDRIWKPLFRVSLPKINATGEYAPLKFNFENYTCESIRDGTTGEAAENEESAEFSQLRAHSARTITPLADVNTKLYIGTENGEIVYTDWKLVKEESERMQSSKPLHCFNIHPWQVKSVQRSPFFKDIILTTGSWNIAIWKEGVMDSPIFMSQSFDEMCSVGCWSLSRPAVFFIGKDNGNIDVWNLLKNTEEPVQVKAHATNGLVTCITPWIASPKQHYLAVADCLGIVCVFEIPKKLYTPSRNEMSSMKKFFEVGEETLKDSVKRQQWDEMKREADELNKDVEVDIPHKHKEEIEAQLMDYYKLQESIRSLTPATDGEDA